MRIYVDVNRWRYCLIIVFFIAGCATAGMNFVSSSVPMIEPNSTTEGEIREWFGKSPDEYTQNTAGFETKVLSYDYAKQSGISAKMRLLSIEIKNGVVYSYTFVSSFREDATDFDTTLRNQLEIGQTTMTDAKGILGAPGGKIQVPTNILPEELRKAAPEGTKEMWDYCYVTARTDHNLVKTFVKRLVLYFDDTGILVHMYFFEGDA